MTWLAPVNAQVITQKVGNSYIFIFPATQGRITATETPAGRIDIGTTITVMYGLKVSKGRSRFILMDGTKTEGITPKLTMQHTDKLFGFKVKDVNQPLLHIYIDPSFMEKMPPDSKDKLEGEKPAREGNLDVIIEKKGKDYRIKEVRLN